MEIIYGLMFVLTFSVVLYALLQKHEPDTSMFIFCLVCAIFSPVFWLWLFVSVAFED